jgi:hypothetical protein
MRHVETMLATQDSRTFLAILDVLAFFEQEHRPEEGLGEFIRELAQIQIWEELTVVGTLLYVRVGKCDPKQDTTLPNLHQASVGKDCSLPGGTFRSLF